MTPQDSGAVDDSGMEQPAPGTRAVAHRTPLRIVINAVWCKGCYICVSVCPRDVLAIDQGAWTGSFHPVIVAQAERCTVCRNCELLCPDLAIEVLSEA
jgi:2-oxoglutarate ferredoxin oxidoreductase subunit delta